MNNLQILLKLRGLTAKQISGEIGQGYHTTQKIIKRATYKRPDGTRAVRSNRQVEERIAGLLGLSHADVWGDGAEAVLRELIMDEIKRQTEEQQRSMCQQWLTDSQ